LRLSILLDGRDQRHDCEPDVRREVGPSIDDAFDSSAGTADAL
jgi:hypothetical protein